MNKKILLLLLGLVLISGCGKHCLEYKEIYYCKHEVSCNGSLSDILIFTKTNQSNLTEIKVTIENKDYTYLECMYNDINVWEYESDIDKIEYVYNATYNVNVTDVYYEPKDYCVEIEKGLRCVMWDE